MQSPNRVGRVLLAAVGLAVLAASAPSARPSTNRSAVTNLAPGTYFSDDMEGDTSGWVAESPWQVGEGPAHSPTHFWVFHWNPNGTFGKIARVTSSPIDLRSAVNPILRFWYASLIDDPYAGGSVAVTVDDGATFHGLGSYRDTSLVWRQEKKLDLSPYAGAASLRVVFFGAAVNDLVHFQFDDVEVLEEPLPGAFLKSAPVNGAFVQETSLTIAWGASEDAASYEYCVDTTDNNTCDGTWTSTSSTSAPLAGLARNTAYWWQVRARNVVGTTEADAGGWWSFTMGGAPAAFTKSAPGNGVRGQSVNPVVSWAPSTGADTYEYCIDTTNNNSCDATWASTTGTSAEIAALTGATAYWWQVRARNGAGPTEADGGAWWAFTTAVRTNDFDGDGKTDVAVFRPSTGFWYALKSSADNTASFGVSWGLSTDVPMPGDYDGDGKTDPAIFRPSTGLWAILKSSTNYTSAIYVSWGLGTDVPVPADFDGDGKTDPSVFRPSTGGWYALKSSAGYGSYIGVLWGLSTDVPLPGDYDGDGKADPAVFRPSTGGWYALKSSAGYGSYLGVFWGLSTDVPVPGDYDGDGKIDPAVFRASTGGWYVLQSHTTYTTSAGDIWGGSGDLPVAGDFDGDGKTDFAVFTPSTGAWSIMKSGTVGLAHWWRLDEASGGVARDATGDGTTDGTLGSGAHPVAGHIGPGALQFDAFDPNGYVNMPASVAALGTSNFTISFWMIKAPDPTAKWGTLVGNRGGFNGADNLVQFYGDDSTITFEIAQSASGGYLRLDTGALSLTDGQWHRITGVRAGPTASLYVDGALQATGTAAQGVIANVTNGWDFTVGVNDYERAHTELNCGCRFDDVQIYNRALSAHDIQSNTADVTVSWGLSTDTPIGRRP